MKNLRLILFALVALAHGLVIYFFAFNINAAPVEKEESARVMKLTDLAEYIPPPPEPPPPPPPREEPLPDNAVESIAEQMIETDKEPENQTIVEAGSITTPVAPQRAASWDDYLPAHRISVPAKFPPDSELLKGLIYPPIAKRSGIEGRVILDLFIDRNGIIQRIEILREDPANRGFGEAARDAFRSVRCEPAQANGENVSTRVRYPVNFTLR
jgi:protein TonB